MIPKFYSVADGLTLRVCKTEKFKSDMLSVSLVLPIGAESAYKTSLLLSVLRRGTQSYPTLAALNARLDYLFGTELSIRNFYRGDSQIIGFSADFLNDRYLEGEGAILEDVIRLMAELLFCPLLDENGLLLEKYVESEKVLQCETIRSAKNNPRAYATDRLRELMFASEPCGAPIFGSEEQVMAVSAAELTAHWRELLLGLSLDCFYVGAAEPERIGTALRNSFGTACLAKKVEFQCIKSLPKQEVAYAEEDLPVSQGHLLLGFQTGITVSDPDFYACTLLNEILGASPISKLFMNVREKLSLCYHCSSTYNIYKGVLLISCGLEPCNRALAEKEILHQLELLKKGEFSEEELLAAKKSMGNLYRQLLDSPAALESFYYGRSLVGLDLSLEECRDRILAVTREEIVAVANKLSSAAVFFLNGTLSGEGENDFEED